MSLLNAKNLTKKFSDFTAVNDLTFNVNKGDIYGFLGPNGAGKSTSLRMVLGLIHPTSGTVMVNNQTVNKTNRKYLSSIGALIERPDFYTNLSAYDNLKILAKLSNLRDKKRINEVLEEVGLIKKANVKVGSFSQGMKQRLGIAQALLHQPELIILDEPSNGLDPQGQIDMRKLIQRINSDLGITIIISSHILSEIEQIANRMIVINNGEKIVEGDVTQLMNSEQMKVRIKVNQLNSLKELLKSKKLSFDMHDEFVIVKLKESEISSLVNLITDNNISIQEVRQLRTLEELFLKWTQ
ncbi:ABC transporter ATP-binding protein [Flavobacteriales bacterium]|nr:ABC transporter ATP-binding protein [Flavobacteriales bacterium]